jgi:ketosteroid isomerase-like protein
MPLSATASSTNLPHAQPQKGGHHASTSRIAISLMLLIVAGAARAGTEDEVKALFAKFVAAQNAHDLNAVGELLQDSPQFLWITRGMPIWGPRAALKRFESLYQGTWSLDPKIDELRVIESQPGVVQLYVPIRFMISPAGQPAQPARFLINQVVVKTGRRLEGIEHPSDPSTAAIAAQIGSTCHESNSPTSRQRSDRSDGAADAARVRQRVDRITSLFAALHESARSTHRRFNDVRSYVGSWG